MIAIFFTDAETGLYAVAIQVTVIPLTLIGTSVQQVYYQAASEAYNEGRDKISHSCFPQ